MMYDLSILIPARNEEWLARTVEDILLNKTGNTEIIVVLDGEWAAPPIPQHDHVTVLFNPESVGQRAATNQAARISNAKYIMKADAHCAFGPGFDTILMEDMEPDWTVVPRMYNLHVFDWQCKGCQARTYQGPQPTKCQHCDGSDFERVIVWQPRRTRRTDFARFDSNLRFGYWRAYEKRQAAAGDIADLMCCVGACWMMERARYWELGGMDERHGSWGQMGVEVACKSWLSGGRQVVNKKTWFAHLFRTQQGFGFPYPLTGKAVSQARQHSRNLWQGNQWELAKYPLEWLIKKFAPIPGWESFQPDPEKELTKGIIYYTDSLLDEIAPAIANACRQQLTQAAGGLPIVSASLKPLDFGHNVVIDKPRGILTMFEQILAALKASQADIIYFCEHDILYHPQHFQFTPPAANAFYYNENTWKVDAASGRALFYYTKQTSGLSCFRELAIQHYEARIERVKREGKYNYSIGFEPGCHAPPRGIDDHEAISWFSELPNVDIRHSKNLTPTRWRREQFRNKKFCQGWRESDLVPGWGVTAGRFDEFIKGVTNE